MKFRSLLLLLPLLSFACSTSNSDSDDPKEDPSHTEINESLVRDLQNARSIQLFEGNPISRLIVYSYEFESKKLGYQESSETSEQKILTGEEIIKVDNAIAGLAFIDPKDNPTSCDTIQDGDAHGVVVSGSPDGRTVYVPASGAPYGCYDRYLTNESYQALKLLLQELAGK